MLLHRMSCSLDEELENVDFPELFHGVSPPPSPLSTSLILVFPEIAWKWGGKKDVSYTIKANFKESFLRNLYIFHHFLFFDRKGYSNCFQSRTVWLFECSIFFILVIAYSCKKVVLQGFHASFLHMIQRLLLALLALQWCCHVSSSIFHMRVCPWSTSCLSSSACNKQQILPYMNLWLLWDPTSMKYEHVTWLNLKYLLCGSLG